ncbi:TlpA family protein disulfide reductase [Solitalea lacus]|uniref:TlpA family protein disulfide reductase n=1 Tax=Solitalea lacus TaxID=2911172 RepID=UPI001EDABB18|nr:TlpA disulfide reductase family protein [Solitalea lacus]UKJ06015.1 TlpA family protein disulfide reductase [Solitalea lacus]
MRTLLLMLLLVPILSCGQQKKQEIIIKDANNKVISYDEMSYLLLTGDYKMQNVQNDAGEFTEIKLQKNSLEEKDAALTAIMTPNRFFTKDVRVPNFQFTTLDGKSLSFEQLKGKVIVVNFWFTTCAPCLKELPELNEIAEYYKQNPNVVFLAFSTDKKEKVELFLAKREFNYQQVVDAEKQIEELEIGTFPTNLIITPQGKTQFIVGGFIPPIKSILMYQIDKALRIK